MRLGELLFNKRRRQQPEHLRRGRWGEQAAYAHLRKLGYTVVARNYRPRHGRGEVDLIGWDGEQLAFVEVKTRSSVEFGAPATAIDSCKREHLIRAAEDYLRRASLEWPVARFDTVSVIAGNPVQIELCKDAFSRRPAGASQ